MNLVLIITTAVFVVLLYIAWLNGLFLRCPHCRKIGSWRFDAVEPPVEERDEEGTVRSRRQIRVCPRYRKRILDKWSDHDGRTLEMIDE